MNRLRMTFSFYLKFWLFISFLAVTGQSVAQLNTDIARQKNAIESAIASLRKNTILEAGKKSNQADSLFQVAKTLNLPCQQMESRILQSYYLDELGMVDSALIQLLWVNSNLNQSCGPHLRWWLYSGLTNVYLTIGELQKVDSLSSITQKEWFVSHSDYSIYFSILTNGAIALATEGNSVESIQLLKFILSEARRVKDLKYTQKSLINLATVMDMIENLDSAYYYLRLAAENSKATDEVDAFMTLLMNLAVIDMRERRYDQANKWLDSVYSMSLNFNNLESRADVLMYRSLISVAKQEYKEAYAFQREFSVLRDSILNKTKIKAVADMQEKYESEKKARQIQQLEISNLDANLKNEKIRNTRNRFIFVGAGILLLAIGLFGRLRLVHRSKRAIQKEKDISEGLLLNILPATVADELKQKGYAEAKLYDQATILFSDFKSFTTIAGEMSPADLVNEINICFKAFDEIMAQYGLEKIKTIGDAYMAAGAVPDNNKAEAIHVIGAALAMQDFIKSRKKQRDEQHQAGFEMRVGIHTGPVVAGIVGVKKFQYDLWGDTVNIASRMETYSEPGYVNISATTYELVKNDPSLKFTPRGMIQVKGKGEMMMYFVTN